MKNDIFGELEFNVGWKAKKTINIFGNNYQITLKVKAYFEEDGITEEQEAAYLKFLETEEELLDNVSKLLKNMDPLAEKRYIPKNLLVDRDGSLALLCDDEEEPDEGIAVCILPKLEVFSQDDYL